MSTRGKVNGKLLLVEWERVGGKHSKVITEKDRLQNHGKVWAVGGAVENRDLVPGCHVYWCNDQVTSMGSRYVELDGVQYLVMREESIIFYEMPLTDGKTGTEGTVA